MNEHKSKIIKQAADYDYDAIQKEIKAKQDKISEEKRIEEERRKEAELDAKEEAEELE